MVIFVIGVLNLSNIQSLCRKYTNLSATDIEKLIEMETTLAYYAELTDCYMFIDCMIENLPHAIVVAEAYPKKQHGLYEKTVIGKFVLKVLSQLYFLLLKIEKNRLFHEQLRRKG